MTDHGRPEYPGYWSRVRDFVRRLTFWRCPEHTGMGHCRRAAGHAGYHYAEYGTRGQSWWAQWPDDDALPDDADDALVGYGDKFDHDREFGDR